MSITNSSQGSVGTERITTDASVLQLLCIRSQYLPGRDEPDLDPVHSAVRLLVGPLQHSLLALRHSLPLRSRSNLHSRALACAKQRQAFRIHDELRHACQQHLLHLGQRYVGYLKIPLILEICKDSAEERAIIIAAMVGRCGLSS